MDIGQRRKINYYHPLQMHFNNGHNGMELIAVRPADGPAFILRATVR